MQDHDRLISQNELLIMIPFSKMTIWRYENEGRFPKRIKLGPNRIAWSLQEVVDWIEEKKNARTTNTH